MLKMTKNAFLSGVCSICGALLLASCSSRDQFIGTWTATAPTDITAKVPAAATASSLISINFLDNAQKDGGSVALSSILDISQAVDGDSISMNRPYEVNVVGTATVGGTWTFKDDDHDELLLSFDLSSLNVNIDNNGVTYTQNILTGAQQPQLDSLTAATISAWKQEISRVMRADLSRFSVLDDVEVTNKGQVLTFEIQSPETKLHFRRVEP